MRNASLSGKDFCRFSPLIFWRTTHTTTGSWDSIEHARVHVLLPASYISNAGRHTNELAFSFYTLWRVKTVHYANFSISTIAIHNSKKIICQLWRFLDTVYLLVTMWLCGVHRVHRRRGRVHPLHLGHQNTVYEPGINPPPPANLYSRSRDVNPTPPPPSRQQNSGAVHPLSPPPHYDFYYPR